MSPQRGLASTPSLPFPGPGDLIAGRYRIERKIGSGGMGIVVRAMDEQTSTRVAIKLLRPREPEPSSEHNRPEESGIVDRSSVHDLLSTRLIREASAASRLSSAHVTRVLDVGRLESGDPYVVMELLEGVDLQRYARMRGALPIPEAVNMVLQACEAIFEAHELGIVHRDLKPANLFLAQQADGSTLVKVLDFGISKVLDADDNQLTQTSDMLGSPLFMAPEQIRNARDVDGRADVWSLGTILYRLVCGRAAFETSGAASTLAAILTDAPEPPRSLRPDLSPDLEAVILRCLEKDCSRRVQTVRELAIALQRFAVAQSGALLPLVQPPLPPPVTGNFAAAPSTGNFAAAPSGAFAAAAATPPTGNFAAAPSGAFAAAAATPATGNFAAPSTGNFAAAPATASVAPNAVTLTAPGKRTVTLGAALAVFLVTLIAGAITAWWVLIDSRPQALAGGAPATSTAAPAMAQPTTPATVSAAPEAPASTIVASAATAAPADTPAPPRASAAASTSTTNAPPRHVPPAHGKPSDDPLGDRY